MDLLVVFGIGLLGSAHCIGMCGGFVLALTHGDRGGAWLHVHQTLYYLGKTATYTAFGALAGAFGAAVGAVFAGAQNVLSVGLGVVLIGLGVALLGGARMLRGSGRFAGLGGISRALGALLRRRSGWATLGLGALNGLLPCGLVYALLVKAAATGTVWGGALTMAVFGLATIPALYALALGGRLLQPLWRTRLNRLGAAFVIVLGLMTLVRGTPAQGWLMGHLHGDHAPVEQVEDAPMPHGAHTHH